MKFSALLWPVAIAVVAYCAVVLLVWSQQDRMIFLPDRDVEGDPSDVGLEFHDAWFTTDDGLVLHGWFVPAPDAPFTVIFCHGNAGDVGDRLSTLEVLHELGLSVLIFDYRGYGNSEGEPDEAGLYSDAEAAWRHLVSIEGVPPREVVVWGRSLGGAVAAHLARTIDPAALIVESSFPSAIDVARRAYGWLPVDRLLRSRFDAAAALAGTGCPKLFLHSPDDEMIPYELGTRLYEAAASPKRRVDLRGGHNDGFLVSRRIVVEQVGDFLRELDGASR